MIIINFVPQNLSGYEMKNIKRGLRSFFEYGDGRQCEVRSDSQPYLSVHFILYEDHLSALL